MNSESDFCLVNSNTNFFSKITILDNVIYERKGKIGNVGRKKRLSSHSSFDEAKLSLHLLIAELEKSGYKLIPSTDLPSKNHSIKDEDSAISQKNSKRSSKRKREEYDIAISQKKSERSIIIPIDSHCPILSFNHVYSDYNCMLNQTDITDNHNKYYLCQLLESNEGNNYSVWFRWGRVGKTAGVTLKEFINDLESAKKMFEQKFKDKTKNSWADKDRFVPHPGKYTLLAMDYSIDEKKEVKNEALPICSLPEKTAQLVELIFNIQMMADQLTKVGYDVNRLPLGKLNKQHILKGYSVLNNINNFLNGTKKNYSEIQRLSNLFYTLIPHDFGMKRPDPINSKIKLKLKLQLLESLSDIEIAHELLEEEKRYSSVHPLDRHYITLNCELEYILSSSEEYLIISKYSSKNHAPTHSSYTLAIEDIYKVRRHDEREREIDNSGTRMLLWHGSRLSNFVGILSQGLRIAPPEAPRTGYMFGKGVYFSDMVSKSANYCNASASSPYGILVLCEVFLGKSIEKFSADYEGENLPDSYSSTKGCGKTIPNPKEHITLPDGLIMPIGEPLDISEKVKSDLLYNEYIVYDTSQVIIRYLIKVKFHFK